MAIFKCYGHPIIKTPNINVLAKEGVLLTNCYSASPNCSPSRTGILTGRSPYRVGMYDFAHYAPLHIPESELTIAEAVKSAGYQTMFAGKWHCTGAKDWTTHPNPGEHGFDHWYAHPKNFGHNPKGFCRNGENLPQQKGWMSELVVNEAMDFIKNRDMSKPFITMLWFSEPHTPVVAAPEFSGMYKNLENDPRIKEIKHGGPQVDRHKADEKRRATYYGCVSMLDHHIGRLLTYLKENGLNENTIIVFTSDNGPEHRANSSFGSPGNLRGAKGHMHEGGYHVPGIIKWPGKIAPGSVSNTVVNGTDYLPSLASVAEAKLKTKNKIDGVNVFPALTNGKALTRSTPAMWWLFHARGGKEVSMRIGDYKMLANMTPGSRTKAGTKPLDGQSTMDFIKKANLDNFTLYNLKDDLGETTELSKKHPEIYERMRKKMISLHQEIRNEGPYYELVKKK